MNREIRIQLDEAGYYIGVALHVEKLKRMLKCLVAAHDETKRRGHRFQVLP